MKLDCAGAPHLTYCTNIHPGETWEAVRRNLVEHVCVVKAQVSPSAPFAVGLRLSARAADELWAPGEIDRLRAFLAEHDLYVPTLNGFPHGVFHGAVVKEAVYLPDWRDPLRLAYTDRLAEILAALLPDDGAREGSVSTLPGAFKPLVATPADEALIAEGLLRHAAHLHRLRERTGKTITLALEPEPFCHLETIADAIVFFEEHLLTRAAVARFADLAGASPRGAEESLRRHLGVCLDTCHEAVQYQDAAIALDALARAGIKVGKIQLSAGLEVDFAAVGNSVNDRRALLEALRPFAEGVYLHQVVARESGALVRTLDLPEAIATAERDPLRLEAWRIHFHVPVFREELAPFRNTQPFLRELLGLLRERAVAPHLEVETYTWDVLPEEHRREPIDDAISRELTWVRERLGA
jgi:sugar phosphate isomerase/epimerase